MPADISATATQPTTEITAVTEATDLLGKYRSSIDAIGAELEAILASMGADVRCQAVKR